MEGTMSTRNGDSFLIDILDLFEKTRADDNADPQGKGSKYLQGKPSEVCIFRVPQFLKDLNDKAYVPQVVSLGPLHEVNRQPSMTGNKPSITQADKMKAVFRMLSRCPPPKEIEDVIEKIRKLETRIKDCYEVEIPYDGDALAWMLTLDGCFILEFLRTANGEFRDSGSSEYLGPIFDGGQLASLRRFLILRDIMLLENQVPLVVLIKLLELELGSKDEALKKLCELNDSVLLVLIPFTYYPGGGAMPCKWEDIRNFNHLLDLLRTKIISSFLQCEKRSNNSGNSTENNSYFRPPEPAHVSISMPSAEILRNAGIEFERCDGGDQKYIRFKSEGRIATATLFLPAIQIEHHTESILRNLIAYEEGLAEPDNRISLYALIMDDLIESKNDVGVLKKAGVIHPVIGSDKAVATLFNNLGKGITRRPFDDLDNIISAVKKRSENKPKVLLAEFMEKYCSKPWLVISLLAGVALLVMTLLQTVFTIIK